MTGLIILAPIPGPMALSGRLARRAPNLLRQCRVGTSPVSARCFTASAAQPLLSLRKGQTPRVETQQLRAFSRLAALRSTVEAPNAQAYLNSGAIAGARDLVDVKKVLVIGSGGLSIGQAGEFDYSGKLSFVRRGPMPNKPPPQAPRP